MPAEILIAKSSTPDTPPSGMVSIWMDSNGDPKFTRDDGTTGSLIGGDPYKVLLSKSALPPATPAAGSSILWMDANGDLACTRDDGVVVKLIGAGQIQLGSVVITADESGTLRLGGNTFDLNNGNVTIGTHTITLPGNRTLTVPATGTAALAAQSANFTVTQQIPSVYTDISTSLADDAAMSFTPPAIYGLLLLWQRNTAAGTQNRTALIHFRASATPFCVIVAQPSTDIAVATTALTGTTGTDGKLTVSANTDNKIYIENRTGAAVYLGYQLLSI